MKAAIIAGVLLTSIVWRTVQILMAARALRLGQHIDPLGDGTCAPEGAWRPTGWDVVEQEARS